MSSFMANASIIVEYDLSNFDGGTGKHGLTTSQSFTENNFNILSGMFVVSDLNGLISGVLTAKTVNSQGFMGIVNLTLTGFEESANTSNLMYKQEFGKLEASIVDESNQLAASNNSDIDFFMFLAGTIDIFDENNILVETREMMNCCEPVFQFGNGANAKNPTEFGASAWINDSKEMDGHWDINVALSSRVSVQAVSEPLVFILFAFTAAVLLRRKVMLR